MALLVDADDVSVVAFRAGAEPRVLHGDERVDLGDVLPGFQLRAGDLFDALRRPSDEPHTA